MRDSRQPIPSMLPDPKKFAGLLLRQPVGFSEQFFSNQLRSSCLDLFLASRPRFFDLLMKCGCHGGPPFLPCFFREVGVEPMIGCPYERTTKNAFCCQA